MRKTLIAGMLIVFLSACSSGISVDYEDKVSIEGETLVIEGETSLDDGSLISYEITNYEVSEILDDGTMEVVDGKFSTEIDASEYPAGEFEVYTAFLPYMQPENIKEIYGEDGSNLSLGGSVNYLEGNTDIKVIESTKTFEKH